MIAALARSSIQLFNFEFIEPVESVSSVHGGFAPILGEPISGATATARATVFDSASTPEFRLLDEEGFFLQTIDLVRVDLEAPFDEFVGSFPVPDVPFRVSAIGEDANGHFYERLFPKLFRPQSVQVTVDPATDNREVPIGRTTAFNFRVRNFGEMDIFRHNAIATTGFIPPRRTRPDLILDNGETGTFDIEVVVPNDTVEGAEVDLVAAVTSTTNPALTNSATLRLTASNSANLMPIANAGDDRGAILGGTVTLDGSLSRDPDNGPAPLSFDWAQLAGPEATLSGETTALPRFVPDVEGEYTFALVVDDGRTRSVEDLVKFQISVGEDSDGDGWADPLDNCPSVSNPGQEDLDQDRLGDACDPDSGDSDGDGWADFVDNCPSVSNPGQEDADQDGIGDACDESDGDSDGDGWADPVDNCPSVFNPDQADSDGDGIGDACDDEGGDSDGDGWIDLADNCPSAYNPDQADSDGDGIGDACDEE